MDERSLGFYAFLSSCFVGLYGVLQMLGGRHEATFGIKQRLWGRLIAPLFFSLGVCLLAYKMDKFSFWMLLMIPAMLISVRIGYGVGQVNLSQLLPKKIYQRAIWSIIRSLCALPFAIVMGQWWLFTAQVLVGLVMTLILGVANPLPAAAEEFTINFSSVYLIPMMVIYG